VAAHQSHSSIRCNVKSMLHTWNICDLSIKAYTIRVYQSKKGFMLLPNAINCCAVSLFFLLGSVLAAVKFSRRGFWNPTGCTVCYKSQIQSGIM